MKVVTLGELTSEGEQALYSILTRYGLSLCPVALGEDIPGSFWGETEAGLISNRLFARPDTPLHSVLHEACHFVCMSPVRRRTVDTDAGGDHKEENAVCYLQVLLADKIAGVGSQRMLRDMDTWGYGFRLGSARSWFESDAEEVVDWLYDEGLIKHNNNVTWLLRGQSVVRCKCGY